MATASIHLTRLSHNLSCIRDHLSSAHILAAVKANAYGHGAVEVTRHLQKEGVTWFGVATAAEALELRQAGIKSNILIFSPVYTKLKQLIENDVALAVVDGESFRIVERASQGKKARIHLKVDTGMGRLGLAPQEALELAKTLASSRQCLFEGVWTHFANADEEDTRSSLAQLTGFQTFLKALVHMDIKGQLIHAANSAAIMKYPEAHFDMVRPGIALYGYHASDHIEGQEPRLKPIMSVKAPITFIKKVKAGSFISYGSLWQAKEESRIATVRMGYADGYPRALGNKSYVEIKGQLRPIVGRICMDQFMVDIGDLELNVGDEVGLFGEGISAETLARNVGSISYELLSSLAPRVKRQYLR